MKILKHGLRERERERWRKRERERKGRMKRYGWIICEKRRCLLLLNLIPTSKANWVPFTISHFPEIYEK